MTLSTSDLQGMKERHQPRWHESRATCQRDSQSWPCDFERLRIAYEEREHWLSEIESSKAASASELRSLAWLALNPNTESGA